MEINKRLKQEIKYLLSQTPLRDLLEKYRHTALTGKEIFLVSYQNSGSTWLRNLIYEALTGKEPWNPESKKEFSFIGKHAKAKPIELNKDEKRKLIKSHSPYRKEYKGKKVIYIVRDPRDIAVSKYKKKLKEGYRIDSKEKEVERFAKGKIMSEGKWNKHIRSWIDAKNKGEIQLHIVRYEYLIENTEKELKKTFDFLNADYSEKDVKKAIKDNEIKKMKKFNPHARKGKPGNWKEELTKEQSKKIEKNFEYTMKELGYLRG